jgi:hypothetical protein
MCSEITGDERGCVETAINFESIFFAGFLFSATNLFLCKLKYLLLIPRAAQNAVAVWPDAACLSINFFPLLWGAPSHMVSSGEKLRVWRIGAQC